MVVRPVCPMGRWQNILVSTVRVADGNIEQSVCDGDDEVVMLGMKLSEGWMNEWCGWVVDFRSVRRVSGVGKCVVLFY